MNAFETINPFKPLSNEGLSNIMVVEHPHGGIILSFCSVEYNESTQQTIKTIKITYNSGDPNNWTNPMIIYQNLNGSRSLSHVLFLDLKGNLQLLVQDTNMVTMKESINYGKDWSNSKVIYEDADGWIFCNKPMFVEYGRLLVPVYNEITGRSFILIREEDGTSWFLSNYIEFSEKEPKDEKQDSDCDAEDLCYFKNKYPSLIHLSEKSVAVMLQTENLQHIYYSISQDLGETWSDPLRTSIPASIHTIDAIRLRDSEGSYLPYILFIYIEDNDKNSSLNLVYTENDMEIWSKSQQIIESKPNCLKNPQLMQTSDQHIQIFYLTDNQIKNYNFMFKKEDFGKIDKVN